MMDFTALTQAELNALYLKLANAYMSLLNSFSIRDEDLGVAWIAVAAEMNARADINGNLDRAPSYDTLWEA